MLAIITGAASYLRWISSLNPASPGRTSVLFVTRLLYVFIPKNTFPQSDTILASECAAHRSWPPSFYHIFPSCLSADQDYAHVVSMRKQKMWVSSNTVKWKERNWILMIRYSQWSTHGLPGGLKRKNFFHQTTIYKILNASKHKPPKFD